MDGLDVAIRLLLNTFAESWFPLPREFFRCGNLRGCHFRCHTIANPSRVLITTCSSQIRPFMRLYKITWYAFAVAIHNAQDCLRAGITLVSGFATPGDRLILVPLDTLAVSVHDAQIKLRIGKSLLSCLAVPFDCLRFILLYAQTDWHTLRPD